jgi:hypothetical protein
MNLLAPHSAVMPFPTDEFLLFINLFPPAVFAMPT